MVLLPEEKKKNSDIDLLVEFNGEKTLFDLVRLKDSLKKKLGRKIDVLTYDSIHPSLRKSILSEQKIIYKKASRLRMR